MKTLLGLVLTMFLSACAMAPPPPSNPDFPALDIRDVAIGPVAYATNQPSEQCSLFIDEDLRSALARDLRQRGYSVLVSGNSLPRSFSSGSPLPQPGDTPPEKMLPEHPSDGLLSVWIVEYWEHNPCGEFMLGPQYLNMGAVAVLYRGSPPVEVWRGTARVAEQGTYSPSELFWLTTTRLTDRLLEVWPAGPGKKGQH